MKIISSPIELTRPVNSVPLGLFLVNVSNTSSESCLIPKDILSL